MLSAHRGLAMGRHLAEIAILLINFTLILHSLFYTKMLTGSNVQKIQGDTCTKPENKRSQGANSINISFPSIASM